MKATLVYDYADDKWGCWWVAGTYGVTPTPDELKRTFSKLGAYLYPEVVEVDIKSFSYSDGRYSFELLDDDMEFPDVLTLEESIAKNKKFLQSIIKG